MHKGIQLNEIFGVTNSYSKQHEGRRERDGRRQLLVHMIKVSIFYPRQLLISFAMWPVHRESEALPP